MVMPTRPLLKLRALRTAGSDAVDEEGEDEEDQPKKPKDKKKKLTLRVRYTTDEHHCFTYEAPRRCFCVERRNEGCEPLYYDACRSYATTRVHAPSVAGRSSTPTAGGRRRGGWGEQWQARRHVGVVLYDPSDALVSVTSLACSPMNVLSTRSHGRFGAMSSHLRFAVTARSGGEHGV